MRPTVLTAALALSAALALPVSSHAQATAGRPATPRPTAARSNEPLVEFEMMTWPEVKAAMDAGKTTALFYTGGTEQRGPQNVNGGHNLMGRVLVREIALKLGNAIAMPVLPYTPNNASATLPGTIGLTPEILSLVLERIAEQAIITGFKNVVLMGDHGGGQPNAYKAVAEKLEAKYAEKGVHVFYCDDVYTKAGDSFDQWLKDNGYPVSSHAGIPDTSVMLFLGGDVWTRPNLIPTAVGDTLPRGAARDPNVPRVNNGISGDARRATKELGKRAFDNKVEFAVRQIKTFIPQ
jgi:creatinine amidohydrolase/Fe(II)-dependent formamide hydrolase-like protein